MTYQGAIDELRSLENNSSMPDWFKPALRKVRETMEMDGKENMHGEWINNENGTFTCNKCGEISCCNGKFCCECGADMRGEEE